jgi:hypothetical protein
LGRPGVGGWRRRPGRRPLRAYSPSAGSIDGRCPTTSPPRSTT